MEVNQEADTGRDHCESGRAVVLEGEPPTVRNRRAKGVESSMVPREGYGRMQSAGVRA
jgi:hypothetical protein